MAVTTSAGTLLKVTASAPATFNEAGYEALSYTTVGEITNYGELGREFELVTHNPVATRGTQKFKGSFNEGSMQLQIGLDNADGGQTLMQAASLSDTPYSFELTLPTGHKKYFQGLVMNWKVGVNDVNSITSATANIEITTSSTGVGIVDAT